mgnify:CR=1 FL=1
MKTESGKIGITYQNILALFPKTKHDNKFISLNEYQCVCIGLIKKKRTYELITILKCEDIPFIGKHEILYNNKPIIVNDLNLFIKQTLLFDDETLFPNCTYLITPKGDLIKLFKIKDRIILPYLTKIGSASNQLKIDIKPIFINGNTFSQEKIVLQMNKIINDIYQLIKLNVNDNNTANTIFTNIVESMVQTSYSLLPKPVINDPEFQFEDLFRTYSEENSYNEELHNVPLEMEWIYGEEFENII